MLKRSVKRLSSLPIFSGLMPVFVLAHFAHHLLPSLLVPLLPMVRSDFDLDYTQSGLVVSAFNLSYGVAQLPAGWVTDRIGARAMITLSLCGVALAGLLIGMSQTYVMLIVLLILMGVLGGGYHPASPTVISASFEPKKWGQALGLHMFGGGASTFLSPLVAAAIAVTWGWRGSYVGLAIPTILFGIAFYWFLGQRTARRSAGAQAAGSGAESASRRGQMRRLALVIFLVTFTQAVSTSCRSFIPLLLVDHFGVSSGAAAASMSIVFSAGLWAGPLGGYLSDRVGRVPLIVGVSVMVGPLVFLLNLAPYGVPFGVLLMLFGATIFAYSPSLQAYIIEQTSERNRSLVLGIYFFGGLETGGVLTPVLGFLIDHLGFNTSISIVGVATFAVTAICSVWLWRSRGQKPPRIPRT